MLVFGRPPGWEQSYAPSAAPADLRPLPPAGTQCQRGQVLAVISVDTRLGTPWFTFA